MPKKVWVLGAAVFLITGAAGADFCPLSLGEFEDQDGDRIPNIVDSCCFGHDRSVADPLGGYQSVMGPCLDHFPEANANGNEFSRIEEGLCCAFAIDQCMRASATDGCPAGATPVPCDHLLVYASHNADPDFEPGGLADACWTEHNQGCLCFTVVDYDADGSGPFDNCPLEPNGFEDGAQPNDDQDLWGNACENCDSNDSTGTEPPHCYDFEYCGPDSYCVPFAQHYPWGIEVASHCSSPKDRDNDFVADECDICGDVPNPEQRDGDGDGVGDACDNCPDDSNFDQNDEDNDFIGDICDRCDDGQANLGEVMDRDSDGVLDACDICPDDPDTNQFDGDSDEIGDACDNCPGYYNPWQSNVDDDRPGDACDMCPGQWDDQEEVIGEDYDFDGIAAFCDSCPGRMDHSVIVDGIDLDSDGYDDWACDPCPGFNNALLDQSEYGLFVFPWPDADGDGVADVCDLCQGHPDDHATLNREDSDQDGVPDECDMCPNRDDDKAAMGEDRDRDGIADFCDDFVDVDTDTDVIDPPDDPKLWEEQDDDGDGVANGADNCPDVANESQADGDEDGQGDACSLFDDYTGAFDCRCNGVGTARAPGRSWILSLITGVFFLL